MPVERAEFSPTFYRLTMAALLGFVLLGHLVWLAADRSLAGYDEAAFVEHFIKYRAFVGETAPWRWFGWLGFSSYPALTFAAGMATSAAAGASVWALRLATVGFHLLWIAAMYLLGRAVARPLVGLAAAFAIALSPEANVLARHYASFAVLGAMGALAVYALVRTDFATGRRGVAWSGLALAGALLAERGTPVLMLAGPLLYALIERLRYGERSRPGRAAAQLAAAMALALAVAGPYLIGYARGALPHFGEQAFTPVIAGRGWNFYLDRLTTFLLPPAAWPLLVWGAVAAAWKRDRRFLLPMAWLAVPFAVLSAVATRDMVYATSMASPLALMAGLGVGYLPRRWWRAPVLGALLVAMLLTWSRAGDPDGPAARVGRKLDVLGLVRARETVAEAPRWEIEGGRLLAAAKAMAPGADDVWVFTGRSIAPGEPLTRKDGSDALRLLMQLEGIPGRYLLAFGNLFPGRLEAGADEQDVVLVPGAAVRPGSTTAFLARPAFDAAEHWREEPRAARELTESALRLQATTTAGPWRLRVWRAIPLSTATQSP